MGLLDFVVGAVGTMTNPVALSKRVIIGLCKQMGIQTHLIPDEAFEEMSKLIERTVDNRSVFQDLSKIEKASVVNDTGDLISISLANYLSNNPDPIAIESWNNKEEFDIKYESMKILYDYGVKSPWAK